MNRILAVLGLFVMSGIASAKDGLSVGVGKLINNVNASKAGWLFDAGYSKGPWQLDIFRIHDSYMGTEIMSTGIYRWQFNKLSLGAGVILTDAIEVPTWWSHSGIANAKWGWGLSGQCYVCGEVLQVGYEINPRLEFQARYVANERFLLPSHNGALVVLKYSLN